MVCQEAILSEEESCIGLFLSANLGGIIQSQWGSLISIQVK